MKLRFYQYRIPFNNPFYTASKTFKSREGIFIRLKKDGITALGEASPLPGFSKENISQITTALKTRYDEIKAHFVSPFTLTSTCEFLESFGPFPSLQFGLLTLAATYLAQREKVSLQQLLSHTNNTSVPVNAVVGSGTGQRMERIDQIVAAGYPTVKLKVVSNLPKFIRFIKKIHSKYPDLGIRVDANQSWSFEQAAGFLQKLESCPIEYCEEPLKQPSAESILALGKISTVPIALDESVFNTFSISQLFETVRVIILKPMNWGLYSYNDEIRNLAKQNEVKLVYTTSLESAIGRLMTAALATGTDNSTLAHGLDTGHLLSQDVWKDEQFIKNGWFHLPDVSHLQTLMETKLSSEWNLREIQI